ncbi:MAG TPA: YceI family protein [Streptosporangiales bacterium]
MAVPDGVYRIGPESGRLLVRTARTGLGAKAGHDLTIEAASWRGQVTVDSAEPANAAVSLDVDVDSFEVREGTGGVKPLSDSDRRDIKRNISQKILHTDRHPSISFRSTRVQGTPEAVTVDGELTITGKTQPITVQGSISEGRLHATATVVQSRWGIKPYTAFLGALKLRDEVEIELTATLTP